MEKAFTLEILTPERTVFSGETVSLVAPAALGYLGIWANHAPLTTTLTPGKVTFRDSAGGSTTLQSTGSGILQVHRNRVILLADRISS